MGDPFPYVLLDRDALVYIDEFQEILHEANNPNWRHFLSLCSKLIHRDISPQQFDDGIFARLNVHLPDTILHRIVTACADPTTYYNLDHTPGQPPPGIRIDSGIQQFFIDLATSNPTHNFHRLINALCTARITPAKFLQRLNTNYPGILLPPSTIPNALVLRRRLYRTESIRLKRCYKYALYNFLNPPPSG